MEMLFVLCRKNSFRFLYRAILLLPLLHTSIALADKSPVRAFVDSLSSVEQVKKEIRDSLSEQCASGHCWNVHTTRICELVAGLDVKVGYRITGAFTNFDSAKHAHMQISAPDLKLMKLIFSQCKPSNYQYWAFNQVLHVQYIPSARIDKEIKRLMLIGAQPGTQSE